MITIYRWFSSAYYRNVDSAVHNRAFARVKRATSNLASELKMWRVKAGRSRGRSIVITAWPLSSASKCRVPAWAWGRLGHRVISKLAEKKLNPKAKAAIAALLDEGESIADASTWADENRGRLPKTAATMPALIASGRSGQAATVVPIARATPRARQEHCRRGYAWRKPSKTEDLTQGSSEPCRAIMR